MSTLRVHRFGRTNSQVVLALHGLTGHGTRWRALANEHLSDLRVIAPDLRGHGYSTSFPPWTFETVVADLVTVITEETDQPVVLLGHSFGGACALHLAHRWPQLVRKLVLLDPAIALAPPVLHDIATSCVTSPGYDSVEEARADKLATGWGEVEPRLLDAELAEHLVATGTGRLDWRFDLPAVTSYWGQLARPLVLPPADLPTVLVQAMRVAPPFVTAELRTALATQLGDQLTVHEWDCEHMIPQQRLADTAALLRTVL